MIKASSFINLCLCATSFKLLFMNSYISTDFDVHRNWMAITYNLPIRDWYFDTTSEWTLDYPPLFAAFEFILSLFAHFLNITDALILSKFPIRTESIVAYQKITVILSDCVYYLAVYKLSRSLESLATFYVANKTNKKGLDSHKKELYQQEHNAILTDQSLSDALYKPDATSCIALLLLFQPGLLLVDHVHFQYNGLLSGILLISLSDIIVGKCVSGSFWFAVLLNFKHIYLYYAPAYGMYLLTGYCFAKEDNRSRIVTSIRRAGRLGSVIILVFIIAYAPFGDLITLKQIISRLFPFKRGLTHAYWAPNAWSLYNSADKLLPLIFKNSKQVKFDLESISTSRRITSTSGLVQEYEHQYLPTIKPMTTFILVILLILPIVIKFLLNLNRQSPKLFLKGVTLAAFTSYMFGWHVHEKAILLVLLPLVPIGCIDADLRSLILRLSLAGTYSLFPLLFEPAEYMTKLTLLVAYYCYARSQLIVIRQQNDEKIDLKRRPLIRFPGRRLYIILDYIFILALILNEFYVKLIFNRFNHSWNPLAILNKYEFLPLMMTSSISALGITSSYVELYYNFLASPHEVITA